jgi:hypothetical protein
MRFIVMHKVDAHMEAGLRPDEKIIQDMGALVQSGLESGVFLDGAGLHRSAQRVRVRPSGGDTTATRGPYQGDNELVAACVMLKARSIDDAVEHARRLATDAGAEVEVGPVVEAWDLGFSTKPAGLETARFLLLLKAAQVPTDALARFTRALDEAGVLLIDEALAPVISRLPSAPKGQRRTWVDGPFTESKEMIAGFSIIDVPTRADALAWADRYAAILDGNEVDVRALVEPAGR